MTQPTLINLLLSEYSQGLRYYPFVDNLDRCMESFNTLNDLSNKVWVPNKTEDLNLSTFDSATRTNESKILTKNISDECKCKFGCKWCNSNQKWNNDKCWCEGKHNAVSIMDNVVVKMLNI